MKQGMKHILILSSWYPNRNAPFLGNFVQGQAELLSKSYQVTVLQTVAENGRKELEWVINENDLLKEIIVYHPKGTNFISRRKEQDKAFDAGLNLINNVDLIHGHVLLPKGHLFVKAKKRFSCPLVVTEHGSYFRSEKRRIWTLKEKFIIRFTKKHIDKLIAVSDFLKKDMSSYFSSVDIEVIPNPVNTNLFIPALKSESGKKKFLHISTLDKDIKNPHGIIDAIDLLKTKNYKNFELTIISDESHQEVADYVNSKGLDEFVKFTGPCKPEELVAYYQKCDAFILFSSYETFSLVLAEAWACGIPVITTPVGIANNLSPELGIQVKINDPLSLAIAMEKILNGLAFDTDTIRNHALSFSQDRILQKLSEIYKQVHG